MMKAVVATSFGQPDAVIQVATDRPKPSMKPGKILVHVHACSLSPGDYRTLLGDANLFRTPESWPYIPGGDVCGTVAEVDPELKATRFKVGDEVIGTWEEFAKGGLAEYHLVDEKHVELKPPEISFVEGAAVADSPVNGMLATEDAQLEAGDRVLVLGGSGACGGSVIQIAKAKGASYVAATSTAVELVKSLGADRVIDYTKEKWWEVPEFKEKPFDVIIDCAEGRTAWQLARHHKILKSGRQGARFIAVVPQEWHIEIHTSWQMLKWMSPVMGRMMSSRANPWTPRYSMMFPAPRGNSLKRFLDFFAEGRFRVVQDPSSPFPFTEQGVKAAFNLMISRRAKGKVVISLID